jgi:hypothetical protein
VFNAEKHPLVKQGLITNDEAFYEFMTNFQSDKKISHSEWLAYFSLVADSIDSDDMFCYLFGSTFRV